MFNNLLNDILRWSIARRWLVLISSVLISLLGVVNVLQMPLDVFPPFAPPQVEIQTVAPGLAPEQVEHQISEPIEAAVNGLGGVDLVRSASKPGLSMVQVVFRDSASLDRARLAVSERLQQVRMQLPESAEAPEISPLLSPLGTILQYAFTLPESASPERLCSCAALCSAPTNIHCSPFPVWRRSRSMGVTIRRPSCSLISRLCRIRMSP